MATYYETVAARVSQAKGVAQQTATTYLETASARFSQAKSAAQERVSGVTGSVSARVAATVTAAQEAKAATLARAFALRDLATCTVSSMRQKGIKAWSAEAAWAIRVAAGAQARLLNATARQALADAGAKTREGAELARCRAVKLSKATSDLVSQKSFQATAGSAVGGAVALGTGGGATGLAAGGTLGALAGLPFAFFTFGLSVPVGAAIGGGTGLVAGAAAGATAGAVGGGAAGYGAYAKKDEIAGAARYVAAKAGEGTSQIRQAACQAVDRTKDAASAVRSRVSGKGLAEKVEVRAN